MGTVTYMSVWLAIREARGRVDAARRHPALRYLTEAEAANPTVAHARDGRSTACGLDGPFRLAWFHRLPLCPDCFPEAG